MKKLKRNIRKTPEKHAARRLTAAALFFALAVLTFSSCDVGGAPQTVGSSAVCVSTSEEGPSTDAGKSASSPASTVDQGDASSGDPSGARVTAPETGTDDPDPSGRSAVTPDVTPALSDTSDISDTPDVTPSLPDVSADPTETYPNSGVDPWTPPKSTPTETPTPTTETPIPSTETPIPSTETPVPTTETPVPTTETPIATTETPIPPTETPTVDGPAAAEALRAAYEALQNASTYHFTVENYDAHTRQTIDTYASKLGGEEETILISERTVSDDEKNAKTLDYYLSGKSCYELLTGTNDAGERYNAKYIYLTGFHPARSVRWVPTAYLLPSSPDKYIALLRADAVVQKQADGRMTFSLNYTDPETFVRQHIADLGLAFEKELSKYVESYREELSFTVDARGCISELHHHLDYRFVIRGDDGIVTFSSKRDADYRLTVGQAGGKMIVKKPAFADNSYPDDCTSIVLWDTQYDVCTSFDLVKNESGDFEATLGRVSTARSRDDLTTDTVPILTVRNVTGVPLKVRASTLSRIDRYADQLIVGKIVISPDVRLISDYAKSSIPIFVPYERSEEDPVRFPMNIYFLGEWYMDNGVPTPGQPPVEPKTAKELFEDAYQKVLSANAYDIIRTSVTPRSESVCLYQYSTDGDGFAVFYSNRVKNMQDGVLTLTGVDERYEDPYGYYIDGRSSVSSASPSYTKEICVYQTPTEASARSQRFGMDTSLRYKVLEQSEGVVYNDDGSVSFRVALNSPTSFIKYHIGDIRDIPVEYRKTVIDWVADYEEELSFEIGADGIPKCFFYCFRYLVEIRDEDGKVVWKDSGNERYTIEFRSVDLPFEIERPTFATRDVPEEYYAGWYSFEENGLFYSYAFRKDPQTGARVVRFDRVGKARDYDEETASGVCRVHGELLGLPVVFPCSCAENHTGLPLSGYLLDEKNTIVFDRTPGVSVFVPREHIEEIEPALYYQVYFLGQWAYDENGIPRGEPGIFN